MQTALRHTVACAALVLHFVSGVVLEFAHHEGHALGGASGSVLRPHDCGNRERHLPLDAGRFCAVCIQSFARAAAVAAAPAPAILARTPLLAPVPAERRVDHVDLLHSGKRGPPAA